MIYQMRSALLAAVALVACAKPEVVPKALSAVEATQGASPVTMRWIQVELSQGSALLELELQKLIPLEQDLKVTLVAPPGVALEPSALSWSLPAKDVGVTKRTIRARWIEVPTEALRAVADSQGSSVGIHATAPYRFGRAPVVTPTTADGAPLHIGNHSLGTPVDLSKP